MKKSVASCVLVLYVLCMITFLMMVFQPAAGFAAANEAPALQNGENRTYYNGRDKALVCFAGMLAVSISCVASAIALGRIGSAAFGAMSEKPELGGRAIVFLGLAEGIAIYGLIIAIMILNKV